MDRAQPHKQVLISVSLASFVLTTVSENTYSQLSFLAFFAILPIVFIMSKYKLNFTQSYFIAFLHILSLFVFIWYAYPFGFIEGANIFTALFYGAFLHLSLAFFMALPFSIWIFYGNKILNKGLDIWRAIFLTFLYLTASAVAVFIFDLLMYSQWNSFYILGSTYFLYGLSLADYILTAQMSYFMAEWGLVFLAVFINFLIYLSFKRNGPGIVLMIAILAFMSLFYFYRKSQLTPSFKVPVYLYKSNLDHEELVSKSETEKGAILKTLYTLDKSMNNQFLFLSPESMSIQDKLNSDINHAIVFDSDDSRDLSSGYLFNQMRLYSKDIYFERNKNFLAPFGEYMPAFYMFFINLFSSDKYNGSIYISKHDLAIKAVQVNKIFSVTPMLCSELLRSPLSYNVLSKTPFVFAVSNSLAAFNGNKFFENKMLRNITIMSVYYGSDVAFSSNMGSVGVIRPTGHRRIFPHSQMWSANIYGIINTNHE